MLLLYVSALCNLSEQVWKDGHTSTLLGNSMANLEEYAREEGGKGTGYNYETA